MRYKHDLQFKTMNQFSESESSFYDFKNKEHLSSMSESSGDVSDSDEEKCGVDNGFRSKTVGYGYNNHHFHGTCAQENREEEENVIWGNRMRNTCSCVESMNTDSTPRSRNKSGQQL